MGETGKARARRLHDNWFETYAPERVAGIDIGSGGDPLNETYRRWDARFGDGDATWMHGVPDEVFFTVYASHVLHFLVDPVAAIKSWYRILMKGGHLIICVPHRDLYEKKKELPSRWNGEHRSFWLPETNEPPCTLGLKSTILKAIPEARIVRLATLDEGFVDNGTEKHSGGEYSIEAIVWK